MEPIEYLRAIRRGWLVIVFTILLFVGGAWASIAFASPAVNADSYQARAVLLRTGGSLNLETMTAFVGLRPVSVRAADLIGFDGDPRDLMARVSAESNKDTSLLVITATGGSAEEARVLANAYSKALISHIESNFVPEHPPRELLPRIGELQQEIAEIDARLILAPLPAVAARLQEQRLQSAALLELLSETYRQAIAASLGGPGLTVVQPAYRDDHIVSASPQVPASLPVRLALGGILGLAVGSALALVLARFDTRIRSREDAEEHFQLPVLAEIPVMPRAERKGVVASDASSPSGEAFSLLGAEMVRLPSHGDGGATTGAHRRPPKMILVTSAGNAEGKSTVVANLAVALSEMGKRVLVVSCDFRRPAVHRLFGLPNLDGLAQALDLESVNGKPVLEGHIKTTTFPDIWVVPSGGSSKRPGELLSSAEMRRALSEARSAADVILLDTAPILAGSDATQLLPDVDAVLLVARSGTTTSQLAERASGLLRRLHAPVLGVALNAAESPAAPQGVR